jgi:formiminotetrahydrofolate cyclodeaminase
MTSLLSRSVRDFLASIASDDEPVPAGACAAALTGAASAALVVLVCRVLERRREPSDVAALRDRATSLQQQLESLIDADAAAYERFVAADAQSRSSALAEATRTPLAIAEACKAVAAVVRDVSANATGSIRSDVEVAETLASAAADAALNTAEHNIASLGNAPHRLDLQRRLETIRATS